MVQAVNENERTPSVRVRAFSCPHCQAYAEQRWYRVIGEELTTQSTGVSPYAWTESERKDANKIRGNTSSPVDTKLELIKYDKKSSFFSKDPPFFVSLTPRISPRARQAVEPLWLWPVWISSCHVCRQVAIWVRHSICWPSSSTAPLPNPDLDADIRADFEEARSILHLSPRGSAALLRLAIEKLCKNQLGAEGKTLDDRIADLVKKGLNQQVKLALDVLRVTGNEAVHPGEMDLRDDRETAEALFRYVNLIADRMLSEPKQLAEAFNKLPQGKRDAISRRDDKAAG